MNEPNVRTTNTEDKSAIEIPKVIPKTEQEDHQLPKSPITIPSPSNAAGPVTTPSPPANTESFPANNVCSNCLTTKTPLWRRTPDGQIICNACGLYYRANNSHRPVNLKRPPHLVHIKEQTSGTCAGDGRCNGLGGSKACEGCPSYHNRVIIKEQVKSSDSSPKLGPVSPNVDSKISADIDSKHRSPDEEEITAIACHNCGTTVTPLWRRDENGDTICNACGLYYKLHGKYRPPKLKKNIIKRRKRAAGSTGKEETPETKKVKSATSTSETLSPISNSPLNLTPVNQAEKITLPPLKLPSNYCPPAIDFTSSFRIQPQVPLNIIQLPIIIPTSTQPLDTKITTRSRSKPPTPKSTGSSPSTSSHTISVNSLLNDSK